MKPFFIVMVVIMSMTTGSALAEEHPDFSGVWLMDLNDPDSTPMSPILKAQGASWLERRAADSTAVRQTITQTDDTLTIQAESTLRSNTEVLKLDGSPMERVTDRLGKVSARSFWDKDGKTIVTEMHYKTKDGTNAVWSIRRYLIDNGKKIRVDHLLEFEGGRKIRSSRILVRQ